MRHEFDKTEKFLMCLIFGLVVILLGLTAILINASNPKPPELNYSNQKTLSTKDMKIVSQLKYFEEIDWYKNTFKSFTVNGLFKSPQNEIHLNDKSYNEFTIVHEYSHYLRWLNHHININSTNLSEEEMTDLIAFSIVKKKFPKMKIKSSYLSERKMNKLKKENKDTISYYLDDEMSPIVNEIVKLNVF